MTKAAVRAMDTVREFAASKGTRIDNFLVLGGSKRGWTTWLTAAVDPRSGHRAGLDRYAQSGSAVHSPLGSLRFLRTRIEGLRGIRSALSVQTPEGQALLQVVDPMLTATATSCLS